MLSFALSENFTWLGLGEMTNKFRKEALGLEPLSLRSGPGVLDRLKVGYALTLFSLIMRGDPTNTQRRPPATPRSLGPTPGPLR